MAIVIREYHVPNEADPGQMVSVAVKAFEGSGMSFQQCGFIGMVYDSARPAVHLIANQPNLLYFSRSSPSTLIPAGISSIEGYDPLRDVWEMSPGKLWPGFIYDIRVSGAMSLLGSSWSVYSPLHEFNFTPRVQVLGNVLKTIPGEFTMPPHDIIAHVLSYRYNTTWGWVLEDQATATVTSTGMVSPDMVFSNLNVVYV